MERYTLFHAGMESDYAYELTYNIEDDRISISRYFDIPNIGVIEKDYTILLEDLRARQEWKDACTWVVAFSSIPTQDKMRVINFTAENFAARRDRHVFNDLHTGLHLCAGIFVPFASCTFTQMYHQVNMQERSGVFKSNQKFAEVVFENYGQGTGPRLPSTEYFPTLTLDLPDTIGADAWAEGTVQAFFNDEPISNEIEVHLDCVNGNLPKTRLTVGSEPVPFKVSSHGLEAGDIIRVRAGYRYRSSVAEKVITVGISE